MESVEAKKLIKVVLLGDAESGKSCLMQRFSQDSFTESYIVSIEIFYFSSRR